MNRKEETMNKKSGVISIAILLMLVATASAASVNPVGPQVHVTSVELDPVTFYPFETGTINVQVVNSGNQSATLWSATILDNNIKVKNEHAYDTQITLGPGDQMTYTFVVTANTQPGTYFPVFTTSFKDTVSLNYPIKVDVDATDIRAGVVKKPDNFSLSKKDTVNLSIINPRESEIKNIVIIPEGSGLDISPSQSFISSLPSGSSTEVRFSVTPYQQTDLSFHITYQNGNNRHTIDVVLPITIGEDKLAAVPIVNNVQLVSSGTTYSLTGDVSNVGLTDAKSMVITVGAPATAVEPYSDYAIGSLASDDFSSFEVTFASTDLSTVPLVITWKDNDGNSFRTTKTLNLRTDFSGSATGSRTSNSGTSSSTVSTTGTSGSLATRTGGGGSPGGGSIFGFGGSRGGGISSFYPVIAGGIILVLGLVVWKKRKWIAGKLKKKQ
jgi:hypothetical protein